MNAKAEVAVFGGGCFWCTEAVYTRLKGVTAVTSGYAGGQRPNPTYEQVSSEATGHAEVVKVEFDPAVITYDQLLQVFFEIHDPTSMDRQGADVGSQYRSVIFYTTAEQKYEAEQMIERLKHTRQIVTEVRKLEAFYDAESYHKRYYDQHSDQPYCQIIIGPKLQHLEERFRTLLK